ncbi:type II toxin-antitoxin system RelE/ParE family toxin [Bradyrhizobium manausense]|uniref:type II toxin-antitoxin system RelE/ParE family toxin n=1 Tax=Bradyrhizobium manausense TaxID=989370 RepID=UPI001BA7BA10|nr:type II toxin-antitoxin system RelE/ParE family toxin [Bradyrhizobium manausense]MBR0833172.1 type II toxin-antitoxin system RelE/ParE family toxin [Bradyrhizobium manausense]
MANRFRKAPQADLDLDSIWDFIASDSVRAAEKQIGRIGEIFEMLVENPLAGRERRELRAGLRSFPVGNYVIFYVPLPDGVEIIRVMHGRQDMDAADMQ